MGVCLSKGGHGHSHCEDDGFCTPEAASSQYESPNPSGRYSFGLDTPRISADVGDLGALGSLFYKRVSRSRDTSSNYISPLEMFLGGVSGRNRVHHVNQMCTGDFSFASYLSSPLLKGFDVHAMEAVAKSYAESAAKAAARDAFVFLEENDVSQSFSASPAKVAPEDTGDVDDDYAKSGESEEWDEHLRKSEDWEVPSSTIDKPVDNDNYRAANDRFDSVLNAVQARAKARRRQRRKSAAAGKETGTKESSRVARKKVRFQLAAAAAGGGAAGSEDGHTDDDLRSCMESEGELVHSQAEAEVRAQADEMPREAFYSKAKRAVGGGDQVDKFVDFRVRVVAHSGAAAAATSTASRILTHDHGDDEDVEEFRGFLTGVSGGEPVGSTPLVGPRASTSGGGGYGSGGESSCEYFVPCTSFSSSYLDDDFTALPLDDDDDEATSPEQVFAGGGRGDVAYDPRHRQLAAEKGDSEHGCQWFENPLAEECRQKPSGETHAMEEDDSSSAPIPVGCVVVESRMPDGSRDTPQILELSDVELPEMSGNHSGFFTTRILHSGDSSPSSEHASSDQEGSFTFPCLLAPTSSFSECSPFREPRGLWKDPPITDLRTFSGRNHGGRWPLPPTNPEAAAPSPSYHQQVHSHSEIASPRISFSDDITPARCSFSFDVEQTVTKRAHEIVLPGTPCRSLPCSPGKFSSMPPSRPHSPLHMAAVPCPPRSRRGMNKKLKFYSLERASFAAGAKRSKSPPSFGRRQRREDKDGDSSSDLFEIETMSGTNAMGSSRTPPSTPTKNLKIAPAAAFDFERLSNSIAEVSRSRSRRAASRERCAPLAPTREKGRCLEKHRVADCDEDTTKCVSQNSLKGRAFMKLGLLRRSKFSSSGSRSEKADSDFNRSGETSGSEYLENKPPMQDPSNEIHAVRSRVEDEKISGANFAFEWYCSYMGQRRVSGTAKRDSFAHHRRSFSEDRTFSVKN